jgi:hypothetical protein
MDTVPSILCRSMDPFGITVGFIGITTFARASFAQLHNIISGCAKAREEVRVEGTGDSDRYRYLR